LTPSYGGVQQAQERRAAPRRDQSDAIAVREDDDRDISRRIAMTPSVKLRKATVSCMRRRDAA
jgi:hypothetical protein